MLGTRPKGAVTSSWTSPWLSAASEDLGAGAGGGAASVTHLGLLEENPPRIGSTMVFYFYPDFPARGGETAICLRLGQHSPGTGGFFHSHTVQGE